MLWHGDMTQANRVVARVKAVKKSLYDEHLE
jgi:hypothetical protein